jgi:hypothetical protein
MPGVHQRLVLTAASAGPFGVAGRYAAAAQARRWVNKLRTMILIIKGLLAVAFFIIGPITTRCTAAGRWTVGTLGQAAAGDR